MKSRSKVQRVLEDKKEFEGQLPSDQKSDQKLAGRVFENDLTIKDEGAKDTKIQDELRDLGFSVQELETSIPGTPNLLVGVMNLNYLTEINLSGDTSQEQRAWQKSWQGQSGNYSSTKDVIKAIYDYSREMKLKIDAVRDYCELAIALYDKKNNK